MNSFALLADPVRRRMLELLSDGELRAGQLGSVISAEFGVGQPAVSNQLSILRDAKVVEVEPRGSRRIYRLAPGGLDDVQAWVERYSRLWPRRLDALDTEIARGRAKTGRKSLPAVAEHLTNQPEGTTS